MTTETPSIRRRRRGPRPRAAILLASPWLWFRALDLALPVPLGKAPAPSGRGGDGPPGRAFAVLPAGGSAVAASGAAGGAASRGAEGAGGFGGPAVLPASGGRSAGGGSGGVSRTCGSGEVVSGASTISMQVARMADPGRADVWGRRSARASGRFRSSGGSQRPDSGDVSEPHPVWRQRRGDRGGGVVLLRQGAGPALPGGDRAADRPPRSPRPLRPDDPSRAARRRPATGCSASSRRAGCSPARSSTRRGASRSPGPAAGRRSRLPISRRWSRRSFRGRLASAPRSTAPSRRSPRRRWRGGSASCGTRGSATPPWW